MPIDPNDLRTGGAWQGGVAASLLQQRAGGAELAPGSQLGFYRVLRELGRGGMAIVYLAERADGEYEQHVALKWMQAAHADAEGEALFRRERQALADLRHPHIARLLDGGRSDEGRPWFVMEYIDGDRIDRHCVQRALPLAQRLELFRQVCAAVAFAHARGVIHRDIKPSNVLVDADGSAKLLDFGIAQWLGRDDALAPHAFTPEFASPEQRRGETPTAVSDVYQLGRLLAAMLASDIAENEALAQRETQRVTAALQSTDGATAAVVPNGIAADLAAVIACATELSPAARYATADALAADVRAFLERRPVAARPRQPMYVATRYVQRHPLAVGAAAVALAILASMAVVFTQRLRQERDIAQQQRDIAQRERDAAERARASAEAINRFLNDDLLDAANPLRRAPGAPEVTVRQAVDQAEAHVDERFGSKPELALDLLTTLGVLRYEFGEDEHAMQLYDRALVYAAKAPAAIDAGLRVRAERAALLITTQHHDEAIAALEPLLHDARARFASNDSRLFEWELRLLEARSAQGIKSGSVDALRSLRDRAEIALGKPNPIAGEAALLAADSMVFAGKPDQALPDAEYAHAALSATLGVDHPSTLKALIAVGHGRRAQGRGDEAVATMREAFALQTARFGRDSGDSLYLQNELAFTLSALDKNDEAESLFADLVERRLRNPDSAPATRAQALGNLANTHMRLQRPADAVRDFARAETILAETPDIPAQIHTTIFRGKADALRELGRYDEAEKALDFSAQAAAKLPENDVRRHVLLGSQGRLLIAKGKVVEGRDLLDRSIASLQASVPATHPNLKALVEARAALDAVQR